MLENMKTKQTRLVKSFGSIFLHGNALLLTPQATIQNLQNLNYEILQLPPYSPDISPRDHQLFKHFINNKTFSSREKVIETLGQFIIAKYNFLLVMEYMAWRNVG